MGLKPIDGILQKPEFIGGVSPCQDGGADYCNYTTSTFHLTTTSFLIGNTNAFNELKNYMANFYFPPASIEG